MTDTPSPDDGWRAKPLFWRKGSPYGIGENASCHAAGIGGCYTIGKPFDGRYTLFYANDEFVFTEHGTLNEAKSVAEEHWQREYVAHSCRPPLTATKGLTK